GWAAAVHQILAPDLGPARCQSGLRSLRLSSGQPGSSVRSAGAYPAAPGYWNRRSRLLQPFGRWHDAVCGDLPEHVPGLAATPAVHDHAAAAIAHAERDCAWPVPVRPPRPRRRELRYPILTRFERLVDLAHYEHHRYGEPLRANVGPGRPPFLSRLEPIGLMDA